MRILALVAALALLAGCSDSGDPPATADGGPATPLPVLLPPREVAPPTTDTLHFIGPDLTPAGPAADAVDPILVDVPSLATRAQQNDVVSRALWTYTVAAGGPVSAMEAHLWVRIDRQLANPFQGPSFCPWGLLIELRDAAGEVVHSQRPCIQDMPVVAAADREMVFAISGLDDELYQGWSIGLGLEVGPFDPTAPDSVHLLTATPQFDSRVIVTGLREPAPTPTSGH